MPYYSWSGIDLSGNVKSGKLLSKNIKDLENKLLKEEIGLLEAKESVFFNITGISSNIKTEFISNLAVLLSARLPLYSSLKILTSTIKNRYFKVILEDITSDVFQGNSFSSSLAYYNDIFNELTIAIVIVGEKSGNLAASLKYLANHLDKMQKFKADIRSALLMPLLTLGFFFIIMLSVFWFVIPKFESFFRSAKSVLPLSTRIILKLSAFLRSANLIYFLILVGAIGLLINIYLNKKTGIKFKHRIIFRIPILNNFMIMVYQTRFLQNLDILLSSGVHLTEALDLTKKSINNELIKKDLTKIIYEVESGNTLASALHKSKYFSAYDLESLVLIGESSGELNSIISQASLIYQQRVYSKIKNFSFFVQPLILILLGFLIVGLILSVYLPMFTLSNTIN